MATMRTRRTGGDRVTARIPRAQRAREVQAAIDAAALEILGGHGVDGLALTKVAECAGLSNGPLYGRYDSSEDIALDIWDRVAGAHLAGLVSELAAWMTGPTSSMPEPLVAEFVGPSTLTIAAVEIVAVARRFPLLADSVRETLEGVLADVRAASPTLSEALSTTPLTLLVGGTMARGLLPDPDLDWARAIGFVRDVVSHPELCEGPRLRPEPLAFTTPRAKSGDDHLDAFVDAVAMVVSKVGYERTTAHRIARAAGHSFSTAYTHADSKDELMQIAMSAVIEQLIATGDLAFANLEGETYVERVVALELGLCADINRTVRSLRVECFLAAQHHEDLATVLRSSLRSAIEFVEALLDPELGPMVDARGTWHVTRCIGIGTATTSLVMPGMSGFDWTPFARLAQNVIERTIFSLIPEGSLHRP